MQQNNTSFHINLVAPFVLTSMCDKTETSQLQNNETNELDVELSSRILAEGDTFKTNNQCSSNHVQYSDQIKDAERIPYPRTSGARFCPNGQILGV